MKVFLLLAMAAFALPVGPASAHHSGAAFDPNQRVSVSGVVTRVEWTNPHVRLYVEAKADEAAGVVWEFELPSVNRLIRQGWTRHELKVGDRVTVVGSRARSHPHVAFAVSVVDAASKKLFAAVAGAAQ
jgi:Family of unknown function (DUF6152)